MGHLCSCHRAQKPWPSGKAVSQDYLLSRPSARFNGYGPPLPPWEHQSYYNNYQIMPAYPDNTLSQSPYATAPRSKSMRISGSGYRKVEHSSSTLGPESGFSSKASSNLDNTHHSVSAPSTPETMIRNKPPPKPPRMRTSTDTLLRTPTPSVRSAGVHTLKSSIVDVTNTLDSTLSRSFDGDSVRQFTSSPMLERYNVSGATQEKVFNILSQTKEFLAFELEPDGMLSYLIEKGVLAHHDAMEIKSCVTKLAKCEHLIDIITGKSHDDFMAFCDALRTVGSHGYLADFLEALDTLVEIATSNIMKPVDTQTRSPNLRVRAFSFEGDKECNQCSCNNNCEDEEPATFNEDSSFDIDISYINRDTHETRSVREVAAMKRRKRPLSITSDNFALLEEADKYIPVISASMYNQCLKDAGIRTLASLLENYHCIRELSLVKNHLNSASMKALGHSIKMNKGLAKLDIRMNYIGDEGAMYLADGLSKHISLRTIKVTSTGVGGTGCSHLFKGVTSSPHISELDIGFNDTTEQACETVAKCLSTNPPLRQLRMRCNSITPYGARCIFKGLRRNSRVTFLDVSRNKIRDESIMMLGEVLLSNRTLREVNLENCHLSGISCATLARSLKSNMSLRSLDISMNNVGDTGAKALSEGLKYNQALDTLCLNMCNIGNTGFLYILNTLRHNMIMATLKMCYNNIGNSQDSDQSSNASSGTITPNSSIGPDPVYNPVLILKPPPKLPIRVPSDSSLNESKSDNQENAPSISTIAECLSSSESTLSQTSTTEAVRPLTLELNNGGTNKSLNGQLPQVTLSPVSSPDYENLPCRIAMASQKSQDPPSSPKLHNSSSRTSIVSIPQTFFSSSSPMTPTSPPIFPKSPPLSPMSPIATLRQSFTSGCSTTTDSVEQMYETLCDVLQQNKNLKVLLWGNNFDDGQENRIMTEVTAVNGTADQLRTEP